MNHKKMNNLAIAVESTGCLHGAVFKKTNLVTWQNKYVMTDDMGEEQIAMVLDNRPNARNEIHLGWYTELGFLRTAWVEFIRLRRVSDEEADARDKETPAARLKRMMEQQSSEVTHDVVDPDYKEWFAEGKYIGIKTDSEHFILGQLISVDLTNPDHPSGIAKCVLDGSLKTAGICIHTAVRLTLQQQKDFGVEGITDEMVFYEKMNRNSNRRLQ